MKTTIAQQLILLKLNQGYELFEATISSSNPFSYQKEIKGKIVKFTGPRRKVVETMVKKGVLVFRYINTYQKKYFIKPE